MKDESVESFTARHSPHCFAVLCIGVPIKEDGSLDYDAWEQHCNCGAKDDPREPMPRKETR